MTLNRLQITVGALLLPLTLAAIIIAGTIAAQDRESLKDALESKDGDTVVVATANKQDITRGDIRRAVEFKMVMDDSLTRDAATNQMIVQVIDRAISAAEIERRAISVSDTEANAYMVRNRDLCRSDNGAQCREALTRLGFDPSDDDYWSDIALPDYKRMIAETKLFQAVIEEKGLQDADNDTLFETQQNLPGELRAKATIVWHDDDLKEAYEQALLAE